jgi:hypothetical protein
MEAASTIGEATKMLEVGSEYIMDFEGKKLLRKRK